MAGRRARSASPIGGSLLSRFLSSTSRLLPFFAGLLVVGAGVTSFGPSSARAQPFIGIGAGHLDASGLNAALASSGAAGLPETYFGYGAGGHGTFGRVYLGGGGFKVLGCTATRGTASTSLSGGGYGFFDMGYVALDTDRGRVYPYASFGGGQWTLTVVQNRGGEVQDADSVSDILTAPGTSTDLTIGTALIGGTVGVDYVIPDLYIRLSLHMGYRYAPGSPGWSTNGLEVTNAPPIGMGGPYARLTIGGSTGALIIGQVLGGML